MLQLVDLESKIELSEQVFDLFCEDISAMFDVSVRCKRLEQSSDGIKDLKKKFKKISCFWVMSCKGAFDKDFYILIDQEGFFTLGGTFVMHPEKIIIKNRKQGGPKESKDIEDAVIEIGNLLSGTFERYMRENLHGHEHLKQTDTLVGDFSSNLGKLGIDKDNECAVINFEMNIEPFESFPFSIIFPESGNESEPENQTAKEEETEKPEPQTVKPEPQMEKPEPAPQPEQKDKKSPPQTVQKSQAKAPSKPEIAEEPAPSPVRDAIKNLVENKAALPDTITSFLVKDVMDTEVIWADGDQSLENVLGLMQNKLTDYILIGQPHKVEGVISLNDINSGMSPYLKPVFSKLKRQQDIATLKLKIKWLMSQPVYCISEQSNLREAIKIMIDNKISFVPVKNTEGVVTGSISVKRILTLLIT